MRSTLEATSVKIEAGASLQDSIWADAKRPSPAELLAGDAHNYALFLDCDGTLLDIAPTPNEVRVPDGLVELLVRISKGLGGALAVLTGRRLAEIDVLLTPAKLIGAGVHGAEIRTVNAGRHCARRQRVAELAGRGGRATNSTAARYHRRAQGPRPRRALPARPAPQGGAGGRAALAADPICRWPGAMPGTQAVRDHSGRAFQGHGAGNVLRAARVRRPPADHDRRRHGRHRCLRGGVAPWRRRDARRRRALRP